MRAVSAFLGGCLPRARRRFGGGRRGGTDPAMLKKFLGKSGRRILRVSGPFSFRDSPSKGVCCCFFFSKCFARVFRVLRARDLISAGRSRRLLCHPLGGSPRCSIPRPPSCEIFRIFFPRTRERLIRTAASTSFRLGVKLPRARRSIIADRCSYVIPCLDGITLL